MYLQICKEYHNEIQIKIFITDVSVLNGFCCVLITSTCTTVTVGERKFGTSIRGRVTMIQDGEVKSYF